MPFDNTTPCSIDGLTVVAKEFEHVLEQPEEPKYKTALVQIYVRDAPFGGSDKSSNGCCYDYIPFVNGMVGAGMSCQVIHYLHEEHDEFMEICKQFDALLVRCDPGQIKADGGSQEKFDDSMQQLRQSGKEVWRLSESATLARPSSPCGRALQEGAARVAPARPQHLLRACPVAPCSSALPGWPPASSQIPATAADARVELAASTVANFDVFARRGLAFASLTSRHSRHCHGRRAMDRRGVQLLLRRCDKNRT